MLTGRKHIDNTVGRGTTVTHCMHSVVGDLDVRVVIMEYIIAVTDFKHNSDSKPAKRCLPVVRPTQDTSGASTGLLDLKGLPLTDVGVAES